MTAPHAAHVDGRLAGRLARWSLELSAASAALLVALVVASFWDARDTAWGSWLVPIVVVLALAGGIGAGVAATVALARGERRYALALPVALGLLCLIVLVGELFIWE